MVANIWKYFAKSIEKGQKGKCIKCGELISTPNDGLTSYKMWRG